MRLYKRAVSLILIVVLAVATLAPAAVAWEADPVPAATELAVFVRNSGVDTLVHTYTESDLWAMARGYDVLYSGIDNMPATVWSKASGVYLSDLFDDINNYTAYDIWACTRFGVVCTDGARDFYTIDDMINTPRYFYPDIHEAGGGINEDSEINCPLGIGVPVETMFAINGMQHRLPVPGGEGRNTPLSMCTILFGMTEQEGLNTVKRVSSYKRGIERVIIDMGNVSAPVTENVPVTSVALDKTSLTLPETKSYQLTAITEPDNATDARVAWSSSNTSVATVSATGVVTGKKAGLAVITATSVADGSLSATCTVTVIENEIEPTSILLSKTSLTLLKGAESTLAATVYPSDATYTGIIWTSGSSAVATVDNNGRVKAVAAGVAVITATVADTVLYDSCTVTVTEEVIPPTGIGLNRSILRLKPNEAYQIKLTVEPENADSYTALWGSSAPSIVSVDTAGRMTAVNTGVAVISVMIEGTNLTASCTVTVSNDEIDFYDAKNHWAQDGILSMAERGFINGYDDGTFKPGASISRAEFVTILIRILQDVKGVAITGENTFTDTNGHWAQANLSTAVRLGLLGGYGDGRIGPNDFVTREQIAVMLINAAGVSGGADTGFADNESISPWAREKVSAAAGLGFMNGYEDGSFKPQSNATRAEVCVVLLRFYEYITKQ